MGEARRRKKVGSVISEEKGIYKISVGGVKGGTCFLAASGTDTQHIITAAHLFGAFNWPASIAIGIYNGNTWLYRGEGLIKYHSTADLAVVHIPVKLRGTPMCVAPPSTQISGEQVRAIGYEINSGTLDTLNGIFEKQLIIDNVCNIDGFQRRYVGEGWSCSMKGWRGFSGAPLLYAEKVIGIYSHSTSPNPVYDPNVPRTVFSFSSSLIEDFFVRNEVIAS